MLQFIAGIVIGAVAVVAYKNNEEVKEQVQKGACSVKKLAKEGLEKSKEAIEYLKERFEESKLKTQVKNTPKATKTRAPKKRENVPKEDAK